MTVMADILHRVGIGASADKVFAALSEEKGTPYPEDVDIG
jgi:hypothetical protein